MSLHFVLCSTKLLFHRRSASCYSFCIIHVSCSTGKWLSLSLLSNICHASQVSWRKIIWYIVWSCSMSCNDKQPLTIPHFFLPILSVVRWWFFQLFLLLRTFPESNFEITNMPLGRLCELRVSSICTPWRVLQRWESPVLLLYASKQHWWFSARVFKLPYW